MRQKVRKSAILLYKEDTAAWEYSVQNILPNKEK
jgi:hypothetical protein